MEKITMSIREVVALAAEKSGNTQKLVRSVIDVIDEVVKEELAKANADCTVELKLLPSGVALVSEQAPAHEARNPQTGQTLTIPAKNRVKAKIGSVLKAAVNE